MEGFVLTVSLAAPKAPWKRVFVKVDDISAQLLAFADRTQAELLWKLALHNADVATPVPGDAKHGEIPGLDATPHCFYARETSAKPTDQWHFFAVPDDETKKQWMRALLQTAKDGPHAPRFGPRSPSKTAGGVTSTFRFEARVVEARKHDGGKHAEYRITCHCEVFSRVADRRLAKEWDIWRRFSEFDALNEHLKVSLEPDAMAEIPFFKHRRDALRSLLGWSLDADFLEQRRLQLDTFVTRVCGVETAVAFFQTYSNEYLRTFFAFDANCEDVDHSPRKASGSPTKPKSPSKANNDEISRDRTGSAGSSHSSDTSYASAIASPTQVPAAPTVVSPGEKSATTPPAHSTPQSDPQQADIKSELVVESNADTTRTAESRRSRKKKGKDAPLAKSVDVAASTSPRVETEVVRQPTPTGKGKGKAKASK